MSEIEQRRFSRHPKLTITAVLDWGGLETGQYAVIGGDPHFCVIEDSIEACLATALRAYRAASRVSADERGAA